MKKETLERLTKCKPKDAWRKQKQEEILLESRSSEYMHQRNGLFQGIKPNCVSDPYKGRVQSSSLTASKSKKKPNNNNSFDEEPRRAFKSGTPATFDKGCFTPIVSLAVGDPYVDPLKRIRKLKNKNNKSKIVQERPFCPSGTIHRENDVKPVYNTTDSTFSKDQIRSLLRATREAHTRESIKKRERIQNSEDHPSMRNFVTNPGKKGTFGYNGLLFSNSPQWKHTLEVGGDTALPKETLRRSSSSSSSERRPFKSMSKGNGYFSTIEQTYKIPNTAPRKKSKDKRSKRAVDESRPPFRPSSAVQRSKYHDYPQYMSWNRNTKQGKKPRPQSARSSSSMGSRPKWIPNSAGYSFYVKTVALNKTNLGWKP